MKYKFLSLAVLAAVVSLLFSHTFAYNSGANSVTVAVQADALDTVATAAEATKAINTKDSDRYAILDKNNRSLQTKYDKLIKQSRNMVKPDDAQKFAVCTYDDDTLQLLLDSASGGKHTGSTSSLGGGFDGSIPRITLAGYWYTPGNDRAGHRERYAILQKPMFAFEPDRSYAGSSGPGIRT